MKLFPLHRTALGAVKDTPLLAAGYFIIKTA
jgi:hypothetical protein